MTEKDNLKEYRGLKVKFSVFIVLILILSFISYSQWSSKTDMYMNARNNLAINATLYQHNIQKYIDHGDDRFLYVADSHASVVVLQSRIFRFYYRNQLGYDLDRNLNIIFKQSGFDLLSADKSNLSQKVQDLEPLIEALSFGEKPLSYSTGNSRIIPKNPFTKKRTKELLLVTEKIINSWSENDN